MPGYGRVLCPKARAEGVAARADCKGLILLRRLAAGNGAKTAKEASSHFLRGPEHRENDVAV